MILLYVDDDDLLSNILQWKRGSDLKVHAQVRVPKTTLLSDDDVLRYMSGELASLTRRSATCKCNKVPAYHWQYCMTPKASVWTPVCRTSNNDDH